MSFSSIVALISDGRRAALSRLLAERPPSEALLFAADTDELERAVTSGSLVMIEGSRLRELAATGRDSATENLTGLDPGDLLRGWLAQLPAPTRAAFQKALSAPRAWSVKRVAHAAGVSSRQLVRHCRFAGSNVPPKDWLLAARLAAAQRLLAVQGQTRVPHLAHACGWVDARSLRTALKRAGLTSLATLAEFRNGRATVSDFVAQLREHT